jgi:RNA polymerase sigma-70 factor (ECF subfamily)
MQRATAAVIGPDAVELAARGDERAFAQLVAQHHEELLHVCLTVVRDTDLAEDAAQATWVTAWRKLATLREPDRIRPWLLSIGVNEARKLARAGRRRTVRELAVRVPTGAPGPNPDPAGDIDLTNALARLSPDDRSLLALRYVAGLNSTELAAALRLTPSGTRARLQRLLDRLRKELGDE